MSDNGKLAMPIEMLPYEFLSVNGFIYRCHRQTGEVWRLEPHPTEKKTQTWKKIDEPTVATH
jgi:hypothetical protein